jgi:hypothetical protein
MVHFGSKYLGFCSKFVQRMYTHSKGLLRNVKRIRKNEEFLIFLDRQKYLTLPDLQIKVSHNHNNHSCLFIKNIFLTTQSNNINDKNFVYPFEWKPSTVHHCSIGQTLHISTAFFTLYSAT